MELKTFKVRNIQTDPSLIEGLKFEYRDSEARTETYSVPAPAVVEAKVEAPKAEPKPKTTKKK